MGDQPRYGQTGSGKTHSMIGDSADEGITPRLCRDLFDHIAEISSDELRVSAEVSFYEIYNEKVSDLIRPSAKTLRVRTNKVVGPYVEGLACLAVDSYEKLIALMQEGFHNRTTAATSMNANSSRSHAVFTVQIKQETRAKKSADGPAPFTKVGEKVSKISLVDLAGSERQAKTRAAGARLKEAASINKSLTTLGMVIHALARKHGATKHQSIKASSKGSMKLGGHVPYRDSVLTTLLKESLGGNSRTVMIAAISPAADNFDESLSTLRFADRAKQIVNKVFVNEDASSRIVRDLTKELESLRAQLGAAAQRLSGEVPASSTGEEHRDEAFADLERLREQMAESEKLLKTSDMSWEEKLHQTQTELSSRAEEAERRAAAQAAELIAVKRDAEAAVAMQQALLDELAREADSQRATVERALESSHSRAADLTDELAAVKREAADHDRRAAAERARVLRLEAELAERDEVHAVSTLAAQRKQEATQKQANSDKLSAFFDSLLRTDIHFYAEPQGSKRNNTRAKIHSVKNKAKVQAEAQRDVNAKLLDCARAGNVDGIREVVKAGADLEAGSPHPWEHKQKPLHRAIFSGGVDAIETLVELGADIASRDGDRHSALHIAASSGTVQQLEALVRLGARLEAEDKERMTPLHIAALWGRADQIQALGKLGAKLEALTAGMQTPLHVASLWGHVEAIDALVGLGAKLECVDMKTETPLHIAAYLGSVESIEVLVKHGAAMEAKDASSQTPLHLAAHNGRVDSIQALVTLGANLQAEAADKSTPLHLAASTLLSANVDCPGGEWIHAKVQLKKLEAHPELNGVRGTVLTRTPNSNRLVVNLDCGGSIALRTANLTLLKKARDSATEEDQPPRIGDVQAVRALVELGAALDVADAHGRTALHEAARVGKAAVIAVLGDLGASTNAVDDYGQTPLHTAAHAGSPGAIRALLQRGAPADKADESLRTPLHRAVFSGKPAAMEALLEYDVDVDAADADKRTPLHKAAHIGLYTTVRVLLDHGASIHTRSAAGLTPVDEYVGHDEHIVELLTPSAEEIRWGGEASDSSDASQPAGFVPSAASLSRGLSKRAPQAAGFVRGSISGGSIRFPSGGTGFLRGSSKRSSPLSFPGGSMRHARSSTALPFPAGPVGDSEDQNSMVDEAVQWTVDDVVSWVAQNNLRLDTATLHSEGIDGATLLQLDAEMLLELGVSSKLQRTKIMTAIGRLTGDPLMHFATEL